MLLAMAFTQFMTLGYFNHELRHYLLPMGDGAKLLSVFVFPISIIIIGLEAMGAVGFLATGKDNDFRPMLMKMGVAVMVIWAILILSILVRDVPSGYAGLFGERMRQTMGWPIFIQSLVFVVWAIAAYRINDQEG